jgi:uncharacterized membrane protein
LNLQEAQIEQIKEEITKRVTSQLTISQSEIISGPYPPPNYVDGYEKHYPGFLKKAVSLAEADQSNYFKSVRRQDWQDFGVKTMSLLIVLIFICGTVGGGLFLLIQDKDIAGYAAMLGGLASVIWAIWNNRTKKEKSN